MVVCLGCMVVCMQGLCRVTNMSDYGSIRLNNARIFLNLAEYCGMSLNVAENACINGSDYAGFSICRDIVIIPLFL